MSTAPARVPIAPSPSRICPASAARCAGKEKALRCSTVLGTKPGGGGTPRMERVLRGGSGETGDSGREEPRPRGGRNPDPPWREEPRPPGREEPRPPVQLLWSQGFWQHQVLRGGGGWSSRKYNALEGHGNQYWPISSSVLAWRRTSFPDRVFSCMAWRGIPNPLSKLHRRLDSL